MVLERERGLREQNVKLKRKTAYRKRRATENGNRLLEKRVIEQRHGLVTRDGEMERTEKSAT